MLPDSPIVRAARRDLADLRKRHAKAVAESARCADRRRDLPPGSSRAKVTSANARWMAAAEERDRLATQIAALEQSLADLEVPDAR